MKKKILKYLIEVIILVVVVLFLFIHVISTIRVSGDSMYPSMHNDDILVINKMNLQQDYIERFDIVYINSEALGKRIVKRVIALPGEVVEYIDDKLYIDGQYYEEPFLNQDYIKEQIEKYNYVSFTGDFKYVVEDGLFVIGDNRINSTDSRVFGEVSFDEVFGKRGLTLFPLSRFDWSN